MKKGDTLRQLIREAVLAEMAGWHGDEEMDAGLPGEVTGDPRWSIIGDWIEAERGVNSRVAAAAMKAWFEEVMGQVVDDIEVYFGGWVVLRGPGFPGGEIELDRDQLADMFYGRG